MADPLSIIASAITVAGTAAQLSLTLFKVGQTIRHAPEEISEIALEISSLSNSLNVLVDELQACQHLCRPKLFQEMHSVSQRFKKIEDQLIDLTSDRDGKISRMKWFFDSSKAKSLLKKVESVKSALTLMLVTMRVTAEQVSIQPIPQAPQQSHPPPPSRPNRFRKVLECVIEANRLAVNRAYKKEEYQPNEKKHHSAITQLRRYEADSPNTATWLYHLVFSPEPPSQPFFNTEGSEPLNPTVKDDDSDKPKESNLVTRSLPTLPPSRNRTDGSNDRRVIVWNETTEPNLVADRLLETWTTLDNERIRASGDSFSPTKESEWTEGLIKRIQKHSDSIERTTTEERPKHLPTVSGYHITKPVDNGINRKQHDHEDEDSLNGENQSADSSNEENRSAEEESVLETIRVPQQEGPTTFKKTRFEVPSIDEKDDSANKKDSGKYSMRNVGPSAFTAQGGSSLSEEWDVPISDRFPRDYYKQKARARKEIEEKAEEKCEQMQEKYQKLIQSYEEDIKDFRERRDKTGPSGAMPTRRTCISAGERRIEITEFTKDMLEPLITSRLAPTSFVQEEVIDANLQPTSRQGVRSHVDSQLRGMWNDLVFAGEMLPKLPTSSVMDDVKQRLVLLPKHINRQISKTSELQKSLDRNGIHTTFEPGGSESTGSLSKLGGSTAPIIHSSIFWESSALSLGSELLSTLKISGWRPSYIRKSEAGQTYFLGNQPIHIHFFKPEYKPQFEAAAGFSKLECIIIAKELLHDSALLELGFQFTTTETGAYALDGRLTAGDIEALIDRSFLIRETAFRKQYRLLGTAQNENSENVANNNYGPSTAPESSTVGFTREEFENVTSSFGKRVAIENGHLDGEHSANGVLGRMVKKWTNVGKKRHRV